MNEDPAENLKRLKGALEKAAADLSYMQSIVDTVREPLLVLDSVLRIRSANRAFYRQFQVAPEQTEGALIYHLGNREWDIEALRGYIAVVKRILLTAILMGLTVSHSQQQQRRKKVQQEDLCTL